MSSRYYFHLTDGNQVIRDEEGLQLTDIDMAIRYAIDAIKELRAEVSSLSDEWLGWRIEITNGIGEVISVISSEALLLKEHALH